jgi:hypothetical protein
VDQGVAEEGVARVGLGAHLAQLATSNCCDAATRVRRAMNIEMDKWPVCHESPTGE